MAKGKILIVEDDHDIIEMVEYNLKDEGYETLSALNGEKGIELVRKERPDLIILDIMLPVIDGFEVCKILKSDEKTADIPILILSAKSQETDKVVGLELGAEDYVTKPFSPRELIARIRAILRRGRGQKVSGKIKRGDISIDSLRHKVTVRDEAMLRTISKLSEVLATGLEKYR